MSEAGWSSRRPRQRARDACFAAWGTVCWVCKHPGAYEVDHLLERARGGDPFDQDNLRPVHGSNAPCPVCISPSTGRPRCCNQERNRKPRADLPGVNVDPYSI